MNIRKKFLSWAILTIFSFNLANAQSLSDLFGGGTANTLTNIIEGVFSSSNISISDMQGEWESDGPAVCFQGEGFLKKAGGIAASSAIESKLDPYYKQYGLTGATLEVASGGDFQLTIKGITLKGTITKDSADEAGVFTFNFTAFGALKIGSFKAYVQKTARTMDVMFDASKFKSFVSVVAKFTGISLAKTLSGILDSYDGLCVGFHFSKTGNAPASTGVINNSSSNQGAAGLLNGLGTILGGGNNSDSSTQEAEPVQETTKQTTGTSGTGLDRLRDIMNSRKK